jgi:hypothetical protein
MHEGLSMKHDGLTRRATLTSMAAGLIPMTSVNAGEVTRRLAVTVAGIGDADIVDGAIISDGTIFIWIPGDFTGQADGKNIVASRKQDLRVGAWVRQNDAHIQHQRSATSKATTVHDKLRHVVLADEDYGFRAESSATANAAALQSAVNQAEIVCLPSSVEPITFAGPIFLPPNTRILGRGNSTTLVAMGDLAFVCEAPDGPSGGLQAPWLEDFELFCSGSGLRFNRAKGGFSDAEGQQALMRPRLDRLRIRRNVVGNRGSVGIEFNKCFDGIIQQCDIQGFDKGYVGRGSDLIEINGRTRISGCNTLIELIHVVSTSYRYGSGTRITGCDLLAAYECYLRSSDLDLLVEGNYFEHSVGNGPLKGWAFDVSVHNRVRFCGNRMEVQGTTFAVPPTPYVPKFLSVTSDPGTLFVWEDNGNDGLAFGEVRWNEGKGQKYWINAWHRSRIIQRGTSGVGPLPLPFNSTDVPQSLPWRFSPSLPGLRNESLGASIRCVENAFVIPYASNDQNISFQPVDGPITGTVDVWIKAKADTSGKEITAYTTNGGVYVSKKSQKLINNFLWYRIFNQINVENLILCILNKDNHNAGNIYLEEIVISM